jgi:hydroxyacylglutathione hydrolase
MPTIIPIPAFSDNYIWLIREGRNAAVVDPGDAAPIHAYLVRERLTLTAILNTHHHDDHVAGNHALLAHSSVPVLGPAREPIPGRTQALGDGDTIVVPGIGLELRVLFVPGHTAGHIAYFGENVRVPVAFVGDTLFAGGCGRLFEGTPAQMVASLAKLASLPGQTHLYCAHEYTLANLRFALAVEPGNVDLQERMRREEGKRAIGLPTVPSTLEEERGTNPFLRTSEPAVIAAAEAHAGRKLADAIEVFATLREWKNRF